MTLKFLKDLLLHYNWKNASVRWVLQDKYDWKDWDIGQKFSGYVIICLGPLRIGVWPKGSYYRR